MSRDRAEEESGPKLILGLGNPGEEYRESRHNLGFEVVRRLAGDREVAVGTLECNALVGRVGDLILAMPQTYMNRSGYSARCLVEKHGVDPEDVLVVYDEVQLPLGRLRLRPGGSPGGHRGMESVVHSLRTDCVARLRLGVGRGEGTPSGDELVDFVLGPFDAAERQEADDMIGRAVEACELWLEGDVQAAMNRING